MQSISAALEGWSGLQLSLLLLGIAVDMSAKLLLVFGHACFAALQFAPWNHLRLERTFFVNMMQYAPLVLCNVQDRKPV